MLVTWEFWTFHVWTKGGGESFLMPLQDEQMFTNRWPVAFASPQSVQIRCHACEATALPESDLFSGRVSQFWPLSAWGQEYLPQKVILSLSLA